jgi:glycosyltransferase involved in cell wall biosynthesis
MFQSVNHKLNVSVGIPAYNEESNIKELIVSLLNQDDDNYNLLEIIVVSDRSEDRTVQRVKEIGDAKIILLENIERLGQALSQNIILEQFQGDLLLLLNADIVPKDSKLIESMVKVYSPSKSIGIIGGKVVPLAAETFIEKVINYSVAMKQELYESINSEANIYLCHGRVRAIGKDFGKSFRWVQTYGEDAFSYLSCVSSGYTFVYQPEAMVCYRSPQTLKEHLKQSLRFLRSRKKQLDYFDPDLIKSSYKIPKTVFLKVVLKHLLKDPLKFICYIVIFSIAKINIIFGTKISPLWEISYSSKKLQ